MNASLYRDSDLMDGDIIVLNKYSELYEVAVGVCSIQQRELYANFCSLDNVFLYKM